MIILGRVISSQVRDTPHEERSKPDTKKILFLESTRKLFPRSDFARGDLLRCGIPPEKSRQLSSDRFLMRQVISFPAGGPTVRLFMGRGR